MNKLLRIELLPLQRTLQVKPGTPLQDVLFAQGVEFPCGGRGRCKGCKIKVLSGTLAATEEDRRQLSPAELAAGWRLACRAQATEDLQIQLAQWEMPVLTDETPFAFTPQPGLGVAVDLGTTTVVAQLIDLQTGRVLAVRTGLNAQAQHGADIMSRIEFACSGAGQKTLETIIRQQLGALILDLLRSLPASFEASKASLHSIVVVGNTAMHHLFSGISVQPLAQVPFEPLAPGLQTFEAAELGWTLPGNPHVRFLPCLGSFVGSDLLAGVLATGLHKKPELAALIDLGTNGEIVLGNHTRLLCTSTAAGPAFEGARISMGMRAATGAISQVRLQDGQLHCHVLGDGAPRGLCGSGLVDAAAAGLDLGWFGPSGRFAQPTPIPLAAPVTLHQRDIRELQLAKGAIAAGLRLLLEQWGAAKTDLKHLYLAGAFGNYINLTSAQRIGLLDYPVELIHPSGNTALHGAKLALCSLNGHGGSYPEITSKVTHVSLNEDPRFQDAFAEEMAFPAREGGAPGEGKAIYAHPRAKSV